MRQTLHLRADRRGRRGRRRTRCCCGPSHRIEPPGPAPVKSACYSSQNVQNREYLRKWVLVVGVTELGVHELEPVDRGNGGRRHRSGGRRHEGWCLSILALYLLKLSGWVPWAPGTVLQEVGGAASPGAATARLAARVAVGNFPEISAQRQALEH